MLNSKYQSRLLSFKSQYTTKGSFSNISPTKNIIPSIETTYLNQYSVSRRELREGFEEFCMGLQRALMALGSK